jgi:hypothetical protein
MDALTALTPTVENYANLPIADAFRWSDCAPGVPRGEWYLVAFRSIAKPEADLSKLEAYDDWAHAEASTAPGFVHYFKGPLASDGSCMSFCLWNSRAEARAAAGRPAHLDAVQLIGETYAEYRLEFYRLRKANARGRLEFAPYDAVAGPTSTMTAPVPVAASMTLGLGPAAS